MRRINKALCLFPILRRTDLLDSPAALYHRLIQHFAGKIRTVRAKIHAALRRTGRYPAIFSTALLQRQVLPAAMALTAAGVLKRIGKILKKGRNLLSSGIGYSRKRLIKNFTKPVKNRRKFGKYAVFAVCTAKAKSRTGCNPAQQFFFFH